MGLLDHSPLKIGANQDQPIPNTLPLFCLFASCREALKWTRLLLPEFEFASTEQAALGQILLAVSEKLQAAWKTGPSTLSREPPRAWPAFRQMRIENLWVYSGHLAGCYPFVQ